MSGIDCEDRARNVGSIFNHDARAIEGDVFDRAQILDKRIVIYIVNVNCNRARVRYVNRNCVDIDRKFNCSVFGQGLTARNYVGEFNARIDYNISVFVDCDIVFSRNVAVEIPAIVVVEKER